jgi:putative ABC transport system permease protein
MNISEYLKLAFRASKSNLLRTILTALIISTGITALVGILTAIDAIKYSISSNFTNMGSNTFTIRNTGMSVKQHSKRVDYPRISLEEAERFKAAFHFPGIISISCRATEIATLKYGSRKSNPNISILGTDEQYLSVSGFSIGSGRNFSNTEIKEGRQVAILGKELADKLFGNENPMGKEFLAGTGKYTVVGVLKGKGSSFGFSGDNWCIVPLINVKKYYAGPEQTYTISCMTDDVNQLSGASTEAEGLFRIIRKVKIGSASNFEITKSDSLASLLINNISLITMSATIIGFITLLGAAIGLMNMMLVSVTERTREIGIQKALGATKNDIRNQFLTEAMLICQMGGWFGIFLGILTGNSMSLLIGGSFIIPWIWIISAFVLCLFVGVISGLYPAVQAASLDPIEALRYE